MNVRSASLCIAVMVCLCEFCFAVDISRPAVIHLIVRDDSGNAVAGAAVSLSPGGSSNTVIAPSVLKTTTDDAGRAEFSSGNDGSVQWNGTLSVEKAGYQPCADFISLFVGADIRKEELLKKSEVTLIHVVGPDNKAVPNAELRLQRLTPMWTDEAGTCRWVHEKLTRGFDVTLGSRIVHTPDIADLSIKLTNADLDEIGSRRILLGKLLTSDGQPAGGWLVGHHCTFTSAYGFSGGGGMQVTNQYSVDRLETLTADGRFALAGDSELLVVSPEGVPFLYDLNPRGWENGTHRLTLTLPAIRRVLRGTIVGKDGNPIAGVPLPILGMKTRGREWRYSLALNSPDAGSLGVGSATPKFATDPKGQFALPEYFGSQTGEYPFSESGITWTPSQDVGPIAHIVVDPDRFPRPAPESLKEIVLAFEDETGKPIDGVLQQTFNPFKGDRGWGGGVQSNFDTKGSHYFVDNDVDHIDIETGGPEWPPLKQSFNLPGKDDQRIEIKFRSDSQYRPVTGRVVDSLGEPVADADVVAFTEGVPLNRGTDGRDYSWPRTVTDDHGRFTLRPEPDECKINVGRFELEMPSASQLPGIEPVQVTKDHRDLQITLPPAGSIRILLPTGIDGNLNLNPLLKSIFAMEQHAAANDWNWSAQFRYDREAQALIAAGVRVGVYPLPKEVIEEFGDLGGRKIEVKEGAESVLDLRKAPIILTTIKIERSVTVKITAGGTAASGAEVSVYTPSTSQSNILTRIASDLSDDSGTIRFEGTIDTEYVAVARERGSWLGWQRFDVETNGDKTVSMKPTRMLEVHLPLPTKGPNPNVATELRASIQLLSPTGFERDALMADLMRDGFDSQSQMPGTSLSMTWDWKQDVVLEDMPIDAKCHVQITNTFDWQAKPVHEFDVTVSPGVGPDHIAPPGGW